MVLTKEQRIANGKKARGVPKQKTRDWNDIGAFILANGSARFVKALDEQSLNDPEKYIETFLKTLEYFKPKLTRTEYKGEGNYNINIESDIDKLPLEDLKKLLAKKLDESK